MTHPDSRLSWAYPPWVVRLLRLTLLYEAIVLVILSKTTYHAATRKAGEIRRCVAATRKRYVAPALTDTDPSGPREPAIDKTFRASRDDYMALVAVSDALTVRQRSFGTRRAGGFTQEFADRATDYLIAGQFGPHTINLQGT